MIDLRFIAGVLAVFLSSCSGALMKSSVETTGNILNSTTRVVEKAAVTSIDVAGKAAGAAIEGGQTAREGIVRMMR